MVMGEPEVQSVRGKGWVTFDENNDPGSNNTTPRRLSHSEETPGSLEVTDSQSVDVEAIRKKSLNASKTNSLRGSSSSVVSLNDVVHPTVGTGAVTTSPRAKPPDRFENGDVLVSLLPVNEKLPWVTPAKFRSELVPEELMSPSLTLTVEEYVSAMEKLTRDMRFTLYIIFYKRILVIWIFSAFMLLLGILFSGHTQLALFGLGVGWLICNALAIFLCMWVKLKLNKNLEKCMASVNAGLVKHNLLMALDDRGKISCHKVNICFIYMNNTQCITQLEKILNEKPDETPVNGAIFDRDSYLRNVEEFEDIEVVIAGRNNVTVGKGSQRGEKLYLHYAQRWAKDYLRRRLDWVVEDYYGTQDFSSNTSPRHIKAALCPCQYIEEHLKNKRQRESLNPCKFSSNPCHWCD